MNPIPFMKWRWIAIALSGLAIATAVVSLSVQQLNWGLDFTGGTLIEVAYSDSADLAFDSICLGRRGVRRRRCGQFWYRPRCIGALA